MDLRRSPPVPGARNFRDLGGYATRDGRRVRWGQVYRSGSLAAVTSASAQTLRSLGIQSVLDLRTSRERRAEPNCWCAELGADYWARDYATSFAELRQLLDADIVDRDAAREAMLAGYRRLPFDQAPAYRELFRRLVDGAVPLVFNCSAGKDRAGIGAALLLTALGVSREAIVEDYVLTDRIGNLEATMVLSDQPGSTLARQPREVVLAILGCDTDYIDAALHKVATSDDAFTTYLSEILGISPDALEIIRDRLLEPQEQ